jgi:hypothetical protein
MPLDLAALNRSHIVRIYLVSSGIFLEKALNDLHLENSIEILSLRLFISWIDELFLGAKKMEVIMAVHELIWLQVDINVGSSVCLVEWCIILVTGMVAMRKDVHDIDELVRDTLTTRCLFIILRALTNLMTAIVSFGSTLIFLEATSTV